MDVPPQQHQQPPPLFRALNPLSPTVRQFNPLSPTTRQTTRALQEIQFQRALTTPTTQLRPADITGSLSNQNLSLASPYPSPDEMVIQARGRRQVPVTFSPDLKNSPYTRHRLLAPPSPQPSRLMLPISQTRSSPRKRLNLCDTPPSLIAGISPFYSPSPDKLKISPLAKKIRLEDSNSVDPETAMKALSKKQMENLLEKLMLNHPELRSEIVSLLPTPDLSDAEEKLNFLKKNIYKALPNTRLESKTDSMAYNRASVHLLTFKRALVEGVRVLSESLQWVSLLDYSVMAWGYVKATPVWDNPPHNNVRKTCFKTLANGIMKALKEANFSQDQLFAIKAKLEKLRADSDEILICLKFIEFGLSNSGSSVHTE